MTAVKQYEIKVTAFERKVRVSRTVNCEVYCPHSIYYIEQQSLLPSLERSLVSLSTLHTVASDDMRTTITVVLVSS